MRNLLLSLLLLATSASAQVYTYIDAEGNRVFTDRPSANQHNVESVQLAPTNNMAQPPSPAQQQPLEAPTITAPAYQMLRILIPQPDATIRDNTGNLIVTATSEPGLQPGHLYRLVLDSQPWGEAGRSPVFALENIDRGTHQLAVEILDAQGRTLERTPSQPFHMMRTSLVQKRKAKPCTKTDYGVRPECPLKDKPVEEKDIPFIPFI